MIHPGLAPHLLGAHVARGAHHPAGLLGGGRAAASIRASPKSSTFTTSSLSIRARKRLAGFEVPVDDAGGMGGGQGPGHLIEQRGDHDRRQPALPLQARLEILPLEQLHHDVRRVPVHAVVVDLHHVRVAQLGHRLGLLLELVARGGRGDALGRHQLERHPPLQL